MKRVSFSDPDFSSFRAEFDRREDASDDVRQAVADILATVRRDGDAALVAYAKKFDGADLDVNGLLVTDEEIAEARAAVDDELKQAVAASLENVTAFAQASMRKGWETTNAQGVVCGEMFHPLDRVGVYVPGGTAPLVSTALMTAAIGKAVGVPEIVVATPCGPDGKINPALLYAVVESGATQILRVGGAHGIAAMTYGTESVAPVAKLFGPGNKFVVEAKRQVFGTVGVDLIPGPSEVLILADESCKPEFVAADLLAQAEHGKESIVVLVSPSANVLDSVEEALNVQRKTLSRQGPIDHVIANGMIFVQTENLDQAIDMVNDFAPEHLSLVVEGADELLDRIRTTGAIYVGNHSPVAVGDFLAGPSHTLPTGGSGKAFPGITADMFQRRTSYVKCTPESVAASEPYVSTFARVEGLDAHGESVSIRVR
ncbi:histidinol dehydrogenase [Sulfuriroseicoccus oceanibius]|uniref:Histidinol dehydrogenase n=1 Tax=Sulfuriroseicoccus oceanibius TaxID=2707525 RepID=A0A6B3LD02_9BACT|nr:histidinol dehydrogenase [Sulfuriroseicoccus oceanibius]QQL44718.1 histidinol dehydrogenase [Sulfuriroseicoccus oceanibius]